jgi:CcmD family protein
MGTFVAGSVAVWFAVVWYVGRLGRSQRQLQAELEELRAARRRADDGDERELGRQAA